MHKSIWVAMTANRLKLVRSYYINQEIILVGVHNKT